MGTDVRCHRELGHPRGALRLELVQTRLGGGSRESQISHLGGVEVPVSTCEGGGDGVLPP